MASWDIYCLWLDFTVFFHIPDHVTTRESASCANDTYIKATCKWIHYAFYTVYLSNTFQRKLNISKKWLGWTICRSASWHQNAAVLRGRPREMMSRHAEAWDQRNRALNILCWASVCLFLTLHYKALRVYQIGWFEFVGHRITIKALIIFKYSPGIFSTEPNLFKQKRVSSVYFMW